MVTGAVTEVQRNSGQPPVIPLRRTRRRSFSQMAAPVMQSEKMASFLTKARPHRLFAFYRLAAYTGARRGELLYLRWSAVDLDAAEVTFGGSTAVVRGKRIEGTTKGGRSRTVSLDRDTVTVLREHRRQRQQNGSPVAKPGPTAAWSSSPDGVSLSIPTR
jgi:integrase